MPVSDGIDVNASAQLMQMLNLGGGKGGQKEIKISHAPPLPSKRRYTVVELYSIRKTMPAPTRPNDLCPLQISSQALPTMSGAQALSSRRQIAPSSRAPAPVIPKNIRTTLPSSRGSGRKVNDSRMSERVAMSIRGPSSRAEEPRGPTLGKSSGGRGGRAAESGSSRGGRGGSRGREPMPQQGNKDDLWDSPSDDYWEMPDSGGGSGDMTFLHDDGMAAAFEAERARFLGQSKREDNNPPPEEKGKGKEEEKEPEWSDSSSLPKSQQRPPPGLGPPAPEKLQEQQPTRPIGELEIDLDALLGSHKAVPSSSKSMSTPALQAATSTATTEQASSLANGSSIASTSFTSSSSTSADPFQTGLFSFAAPGSNISTIDLYRELAKGGGNTAESFSPWAPPPSRSGASLWAPPSSTENMAGSRSMEEKKVKLQQNGGGEPKQNITPQPASSRNNLPPSISAMLFNPSSQRAAPAPAPKSADLMEILGFDGSTTTSTSSSPSLATAPPPTNHQTASSSSSSISTSKASGNKSSSSSSFAFHDSTAMSQSTRTRKVTTQPSSAAKIMAARGMGLSTKARILSHGVNNKLRSNTVEQNKDGARTSNGSS